MTDLQDSSNIMMKATMKVANDYLKKNLNLTMKDLGFTAYKITVTSYDDAVNKIRLTN